MKLHLKSSIIITMCIVLFANIALADICLSDKDMKDIVQELEQKRVMDDELTEVYNINNALKEQVKILKDKTDILQQQNIIEINKTKLCENEINNEKSKGFWGKIKTGIGSVLVGVLIGVAGIILIGGK